MPVSLINVNIPNLPADKIEDVQITRLGGRSYAESVTVRDDGKYKNYTINRDRRVQRDPAEDTDIWAVQHNRISITPPVHPPHRRGEYPRPGNPIPRGL